MQSNVLQFKPATRRDRRTSPKATRITTACYKACDKDNSTVDWYTPSAIVKAMGGKEGFDLDPCTPEDHTRLPTRTARRMITPSEDGLTTPWWPAAFVWMNPPYGKGMDKWMAKLAHHPGGGIALVPAHMDPGWMHEFVLNHTNTTAILITRGRLKFMRPDGTTGTAAPTGSVFVAYGQRAARNLKKAQEDGVLRGKFFAIQRVTKVACADADSANDE
ncbi:DNA N-6-adenine-methyltransferase [Pseudoxanthomonas sp. OG2]|uniref:DNA N-6-adenine-methyltransferase n=1 Tax=Pseudoxanthomonas sp. OG2 TaxID=2587011 RepID=UPI0016183E6D|nr:DNA N-6-adenine-methyltransferase [Pseudoxanthomonas sp. OG2]MBB3277380.1 hypothetical protein [Pseudoxanthomonas sp. OG2]